RAAVGGENDSDAAVVVDVGEGAAAANHRLEKVFAHVLGSERLIDALGIAGIPEELRRLGVAFARLDGGDVRLDVAVASKQVKPAVEVVVEEESAELQQLPARRNQAPRLGGIGEAERIGFFQAQKRIGLIREVGDDGGEATGEEFAPI